uniref:IgGFc-binding protein N-terminal domain-containing protein n=1 Tax=Biomphalaria glabrata TaxID=6526 RepID=A0A2C9KE06_BIOGL
MFLLSLIPVLVCVSHARVREAHPEINSTMGTQFLFAIPDLLHANGMAYLYIFCVVNPLTLVSVFTYGPNFNTTVVRLQVIKNDFTVYSIDVPKGISPIGKKTTYEVAAGVALGLYIVLHANPPNIAVISMIPLSSWGREYFAMTLMSTPTIIVTTNNDNRINVLLKITTAVGSDKPSSSEIHYGNEVYTNGDSLKINLQQSTPTIIVTTNNDNRINVLLKITTAVGSDKPSSSEIHYGNEVYTNGDSLKINLQQKESFSVSMCNPADKFGSLLGTRIMAKEPVGVISGSCLSETLSVTCNNDREIISTSQDMAVENIPPTEYYGTEFIMFIIPNRIAQGEITAFASNDITNVTLAGEKGARGENFFLAKQGDVHIIRYNSIRLITSTRPIMMLFTLVSACVSTSAAASKDIGEAALTLVVPMRLYFFIYSF